MIEELQGNYSEGFCKYTLYKAVQCLVDIHSQNIMHRDIKSNNFLCDENGEIKLSNFDYAIMLTQQKQGDSSKVGTVCWMAPEVIEATENKQYSTKVDIWSLGIFAMELAQGEPPHIAEHNTRALFLIVQIQPPPISSKWSPEFQDFVNKCLVKDAEKRWSAEKLLEHPFLQGADRFREEWVHEFSKWKNKSPDMMNKDMRYID